MRKQETKRKDTDFERVVKYIIANNTRGVIALCNKKGYLSPKDSTELYYNLMEIISENPKEGVTELLSIHPDNKLLKEHIMSEYSNFSDIGESMTSPDLRGGGRYMYMPAETGRRLSRGNQWINGVTSGRADYYDGGKIGTYFTKDKQAQNVMIVALILALIFYLLNKS